MNIINVILYALCSIMFGVLAYTEDRKKIKISNIICSVLWGIGTILSIIKLWL